MNTDRELFDFLNKAIFLIIKNKDVLKILIKLENI